MLESVTVMQRYEVKLVTGEVLQVQTDQERRWFERAKKQYLAQTKFDQQTDLADLDRLLVLELLVFRWSQHLSSGVDYEGALSEDEQLRRKIKDQSEAINRLKTAMGLTKEARNKALDSGNFATYMADLRKRAKEFGIHREEQLRAALVLMNELSAIVNTYDRADTQERKKFGFESDTEIVEWVRTRMIPEYHAIDEHFRKNKQKYWSRDVL
jgi:hypothetical protein